MNATRRAPVLSGTKFSCKPPRKQKCRREKFTARLFRRKPKPPTEQPRESARGCEPSRTPSPRGCRGSERPTPASSETRVPARTATRLRRRSKSSTEQARKNMRCCPKSAARLFRQEPKFRLRTRRPRGCRGAESPTPASSETKVPARTAPRLRRRSEPSTEQTRKICAAVQNAPPACFVGNQRLRSNISGRAREGVNPLAPRPRGGVGEQRAPRPRRREPKLPPEQHHSFVGGRNLRPNRRGRTCTSVPSETNLSGRTSLGRAREGRNPLAPRPRGGVGEQSAPRLHRREPEFPPEQHHSFIGGRNLRPNRHEKICAAVPNAPPACFVRNQSFV